MDRHIALVGFMGAGKSVVGKALAARLRKPFADSDDELVRRHGPIATQFTRDGEAMFRERERTVVAELLARSPSIIALGGGAMTYEPTAQLVRGSAVRVFLDASAERLEARLRASRRVRPLLGAHPSGTALEELYAMRRPLYEDADLTVPADDDIPVVVDRIMELLEQK